MGIVSFSKQIPPRTFTPSPRKSTNSDAPTPRSGLPNQTPSWYTNIKFDTPSWYTNSKVGKKPEDETSITSQGKQFDNLLKRTSEPLRIDLKGMEDGGSRKYLMPNQRKGKNPRKVMIESPSKTHRHASR